MTLTSPDLPPHSGHDRFHVVLVEPGNSLNVGSVARAMSNLGFGNLHLVAPPRLNLKQAALSACWAEGLLTQMHIHDSLEQALAPMQEVVGFTVRAGQNRPRIWLLPEWVAEVQAGPPRQVALMFGPEDHGLTQAHLEHCGALVRIPSMAANPSFNLAQSVLLALFELSRTTWSAIPAEQAAEQPPWRDFYQLERLVEEALQRSQFYREGNPKAVRATIKNLLRRMAPESREMRVLLGMFGKISGALAGRVPPRVLDEAELAALDAVGFPATAEAPGLPRNAERDT